MIYYSIYNSFLKRITTRQLLFCAVYDIACTCYYTFILAAAGSLKQKCLSNLESGVVQSSTDDVAEAGF